MSLENLNKIAEAAINKDTKKVQELLAIGINYRQAQLYVERFYGNDEASEFILNQGLCKCGMPAIKWDPEPICGNCSFHKTISEHIEYG